MNQYERIVSYIYQYQQGEKGANVGYARIERRGNTCRISIQMRAVAVQQTPRVYLFEQREHGIDALLIGNMTVRNGNLLCKVNTETLDLMRTGRKLDDMDGILVYVNNDTYYSTSWNKDSFTLGEWSEEGTKDVAQKEQEKELDVIADGTKEEKELDAIADETKEEKELEVVSMNLEQVRKPDQTQENKSEQEIQIQSICGTCPFKSRMYDYGKKILMSFPSMKPFMPGVASACVKMELQDIGCLPMSVWSLSGNRFLLHGYYCYRHLIFVQLENGRYALGVPGIFNEKEKKNAKIFGFSNFQSIGDLGIRQGAFGYWLLELPENREEK